MDRACFVIGHPISHSRSPLIHGHWLAEQRIAGSYARIDVAPADLPVFVDRLRTGAYLGGNVTVPHKQAILPLLDEVSAEAAALGAVNTVYREGGRLCGDNTDAAGFLGHLDACALDWQARTSTALVLGAGGAALAIVRGLQQRGVARIIVVNRSRERAAILAGRLGSPVETDDWARRDAWVPVSDLIVNTTALGMVGQPPLELDLSGLKPGTVVDDIVYVPLETSLLRAARARGAVAVDGLGMLLNQAVPGFARWFGIRPQVTPELRLALERDIAGDA